MARTRSRTSATWSAWSHDDAIAGDDRANNTWAVSAPTRSIIRASRAPTANGITLSLGTPAVTPGTTSAGADTQSGFENVIGSHFSDSITGDNGPNTIDGGGGGDSALDGAGGDRHAFVRDRAGGR